MDRKELQCIKPEELSDERSALFLLSDDGIDFLAVPAEIKDILAISIYSREIVEKKIRKPMAVIYMDGTDYAVRYLLDEEGSEKKTWGTASFGKLVKRTTVYTGYGLMTRYNVMLPDMRDAGKILKYMEAKEGSRKTVWELLDSYAGRVNTKKRELKTDDAREKLNTFMKENIRTIPEGFVSFAERRNGRKVSQMLYAATDGRRRTTSYFCPACGQEKTFRTKELPVKADAKKRMECPMCGKKLRVVELDGRIRIRGYTGWYSFVQLCSSGFVLRTFKAENTISFNFETRQFIQKETELLEKGRSFYSFNGRKWKVTRYEKEYRHSEGTAWYRSYRNGEVSNGKIGYYYQANYTGLCLYGDAELYTGNRLSALRDTPLKYIDIRDVAKVGTKGGMKCADAVFQKLCEFPKLEWLLKMGLYELAGYVAMGNRNGCIDTGGETVYDILGTTRTQTRLLLECGGSVGALRAIRMLAENGVPACDARQVLYVAKACGLGRNYGGFPKGYQGVDRIDGIFLIHKMLENGATLYKVERYLKKEVVPFLGYDDFFDIYKDYFQMAECLGKDLTNSWWLMPNHLMSAHDNITREVEKEKDKILSEESRRLNEILAGLSGETAEAALEDGDERNEDYFAVFPSTVEEYRHDGEALRQCIYSCGYYEKVARGETEIAFIRKKAAPDVPFATLEWRDGRIIQLRGYGNRAMPQDVWDYAERLVGRITAACGHAA